MSRAHEMAGALRRGVRGAGDPLVRRAAAGYVAGPGVPDALQVVRRLEEHDVRTTIGYWDAAEGPEGVAAVQRRAVDAVASLHRSGSPGETSAARPYVSLKAPALGSDPTLLADLVSRGAEGGVALHLDALRVGDVEPTLAAVSGAGGRLDAVGWTLPGRWQRSVGDAELLTDAGVPRIRVVKGQFAESAAASLEPSYGFCTVVERLSGKARHVAVATHSPELARHALQRLRDAGTSCELELFLGLPSARPMAVAAELDVPVRVYVPYGHPSLPYALAARPRALWWLTRDAVVPSRRRVRALVNGSHAG